MSFTITESFAQAFHDTIHLLAQQRTGRLRDSVMVKTGVVGKSCNFPTLGATELQNLTRHGDTPLANPTHADVIAYLVDQGGAILLDEEDEIKMVANPKSSYTQSLVAAVARAEDKTIYNAIDGASSNKATYGLNTVDANGITVSLIRAVSTFMDDAEVAEEERYFGYTAKALSPLFEVTQFTSRDFTDLMSLRDGRMDPNKVFMGFKWRRINSAHVTSPAANFHNLYAWGKPSVGLAIGADAKYSIDKRADKSNAWQIMAKVSKGAVAIEKAAIAYMNVASNK